MAKLVPLSSEITTTTITGIAEPVTVNATVNVTDAAGTTTSVSVIVPFSAAVGDSIVLNKDGTAPTSATIADSTFLTAAIVAADYLAV